jgi:hypothetical protein
MVLFILEQSEKHKAEEPVAAVEQQSVTDSSFEQELEESDGGLEEIEGPSEEGFLQDEI